MAYETRVPVDYAFGQLSAGITALDTTLTSPGFATLASDLSTARYIPIVLADDSAGIFETVWVTAHTATSTSVTVVRGREASTARAWAAGTTWRVAPTVRDLMGSYTRATLPTDAHLGMRCALSDEDGRVVRRTAAGWHAEDMIFGHAGRTAGFQQSVADPVGISAAQELAGGMTLGDNGLIVPIAGRYLITMKIYVTHSSGHYRFTLGTRRNGVAWTSGPGGAWWKGDGDHQSQAARVAPLEAGDRIGMAGGGVGNIGTVWGTDGYNGCWVELLYVGP